MLVLTRGVGEKIIIGAETPNPIEITVKSIRASRVQLGVLAPASARIVRKEVADKAKKNE